ncbi:MAG TPA: Mur ligase family protein [Chloroflexota bacterium]|nr:Mur ligase family protein [Chloroflexota bacterium]
MSEQPVLSTQHSALSTDYAAALRYLYGLPNWETAAPGQRPRQDVARPRRLFELLGVAAPRCPVAVVAGTNGKGSTAAMLESILRAAGHRVGLYTQPHLHTYRERIQVDRVPIPPDAFAARLAPVRAAIDRLQAEAPELGQVTTYEATTALALLHFAAEQVDAAVLEIGLGGRLDAVNAVAAPVAVITPIGLDHTEVLGDTLAAIAAEKADVIKPGAIAVCAPQAPEALAVIAQTAATRAAPLRLVGNDAGRYEGTSILTPRATYADLRLGLLGAHQWTNAAVAVAAAEALADRGLALAPGAVATGLAQTRWPGRLELLAPGPPPVLVDGAHNPAGAAALAAALAADFPATRRLLVLGVSADKDLGGIVAALAPAVSQVYATEARHPRSASREAVARAARALGLPVKTIPDVAAAIRFARLQRRPGDLVVVAGSLYVVAEARAALGHAPAADPPL